MIPQMQCVQVKDLNLFFTCHCVSLSDGDSMHCAGRGGFSKSSSEQVVLSFEHFYDVFPFLFPIASTD